MRYCRMPEACSAQRGNLSAYKGNFCCRFAVVSESLKTRLYRGQRQRSGFCFRSGKAFGRGDFFSSARVSSHKRCESAPNKTTTLQGWELNAEGLNLTQCLTSSAISSSFITGRRPRLYMERLFRQVVPGSRSSSFLLAGLICFNVDVL